MARGHGVCRGVTASTVVAGPVARADDDMAARIAAADSYLATRPGVVGYVLRDRKTGTVYRNAHAADPDHERSRRRRWLRRRCRDHDPPVAAAAGGPRRRLTDDFTEAVRSISVCENS
jgi:hypothetical protein